MGRYLCNKQQRLLNSLDNWLIGKGEAVSLTHWQPFNPRMISGAHFNRRLSRPRGHKEVGRIMYNEKDNGLICN